MGNLSIVTEAFETLGNKNKPYQTKLRRIWNNKIWGNNGTNLKIENNAYLKKTFFLGQPISIWIEYEPLYNI